MSLRDIKSHFRQNSRYYFAFLCTIIVAIIIAIIIVLSSDSYLGLLISKNKNLYSYINGSARFSEIFFDCFFKFTYPLIIILLLGLNYYSSILSYFFVGYQFVVFIMSMVAMVNVYMFSGVLVVILFILPVNLIFFACIIFLSVVCLERCFYAHRTKYFKEAYNRFYFLKVVLCFFIMLCLALIVSLIIPMLLKSAVFLIF